MLRSQAITLLNEITSVYPGLLAGTTHISLHLSENDTRVVIRSELDFEQRDALLSILKNKGFKVVPFCSGFSNVLVIY